MNEAEQIENLLNFVTNVGNNILILLKQIKNAKTLSECQIEVAEYSLNFNNNLQELITGLMEKEKDGNIEH